MKRPFGRGPTTLLRGLINHLLTGMILQVTTVVGEASGGLGEASGGLGEASGGLGEASGGLGITYTPEKLTAGGPQNDGPWKR